MFQFEKSKKEDKVVIGENGIKVSTPERPREGMNVFQFMGSGSSSERPTQHIARKVAEDIIKTKKTRWENYSSWRSSYCAYRCCRCSS